MSILVRLRHAWAVLTGKIVLPSQLEEMKLMTALTQTAAAIQALNTAATTLIATNQANAQALAAAQQELASADSETAGQIAAVTQAITAALPPQEQSAA